MDIIIRADASVTIGSGHVMRCLTIATMLREKGHNVFFWMEQLPGDMREFVCSKGFNVISTFQVADICIVDHYGLDLQWEKKMRDFVKKIVVIDDLANRKHDCDVLLDQNIVPHYEKRYEHLVPRNCVKLLGPNYLIMREEFIRERKSLRTRTGEVNRLLVFMGGSDPTNETLKILHALEEVDAPSHVDIVVGSSNPYKAEIETISLKNGYHFHFQIDYMATLMARADFSIGAGGSSTWERCFVGLPSSSTIIAENQLTSTEMAEKLGAVWNLGWHKQVTVHTYIKLLQSLKKQKDSLIHMSQVSLTLTEQPNETNSWLDQILEVKA